MIANAAAFRRLFETYGRQLAVTVTSGNKTWTEEDVMSLSVSCEGQLLTALMQSAELILTGTYSQEYASALIGEKLAISLTVSCGTESTSRSFGTFVVKSAEYDDAAGTVKLVCYDLMLYAMQPYAPFCDFSQGTVTLGDYLRALCANIGIPCTDSSFTNSDAVIDGEKFDSSYTFRDALTETAQAAGGTIMIREGKLQVVYPAETGIIIQPDNLKTLTVGARYGPVNSIVLARTPQEDNVYKRDEAANEWIEIRIENNQLMDANRDAFLNGLYTALHGLSYYTADVSSFGSAILEPGDIYTIQTLNGSRYRTMYMSFSIDISQGASESMQITAPAATAETDYAAADVTDRRINRTILRVNKQENRIDALVSSSNAKADELDGKIENIIRQVELAITPDQAKIMISEAVGGIDSVTTSTGYTFNAEGMLIQKSGEEIENLIDHTGMYVKRDDEPILSANSEGVDAVNLTARKYLIIGKNARLEDYDSGRTACFYIGGQNAASN